MPFRLPFDMQNGEDQPEPCPKITLNKLYFRNNMGSFKFAIPCIGMSEGQMQMCMFSETGKSKKRQKLKDNGEAPSFKHSLAYCLPNKKFPDTESLTISSRLRKVHKSPFSI